MKIVLVLVATIPAALVLATAYLMLKRFLDREARMRDAEVREKLAKVQDETKKTILPLRLQAYERIILFLERISLNNMVMRLHHPGMTARGMHAEMLKAIREEYEHNMTQQMYMSEGAWEVVKSAKEETIKIVNSSFGRVKEGGSATDFSQEIFRATGSAPKMPTDIALEVLKKEVQKLF
jgi:hypothetical protein